VFHPKAITEQKNAVKSTCRNLHTRHQTPSQLNITLALAVGSTSNHLPIAKEQKGVFQACRDLNVV
jgi:hypothetical protein